MALSGIGAGIAIPLAASRYLASKSQNSSPPSTSSWPGRLVSGGAPSMPSSTETSISTPSIAASTSTFGSYWRAVAIASCSCAMSCALDVPMLDPPLAGLTNSGQPSSAMSSSTRLASTDQRRGRLVRLAGQSRSLTTTCGPTGSPLAAKISFMYSLSMLTALASTPAPT